MNELMLRRTKDRGNAWDVHQVNLARFAHTLTLQALFTIFHIS